MITWFIWFLLFVPIGIAIVAVGHHAKTAKFDKLGLILVLIGVLPVMVMVIAPHDWQTLSTHTQHVVATATVGKRR